MGTLETTSIARRLGPVLRGTATVLLVGAGLASIVASGGGGNPLEPEPQEVVFVSEPRVVIGSDGTPVVTYRESTERGKDQLARLHVNGSTFFEAGQTQPASDPDTRLPRSDHALAVDGSGTVLSIHASGLRGPTNSGIRPGFRACRLSATAPGWSCSQLMAGDEQKTAIAMAGGGIGLAVMTMNPSANSVHHELWSTRHAVGSGWSTPQAVAQTFPFNTEDSDPAVVLGAGLTGYAMYLGPDKRLMVRRYNGLFDRWEDGALALAEPVRDLPPANARLALHRDTPNAAAMLLHLTPEPDGSPRLRAWRAVGNAPANGWAATSAVPGSECASAMDAAMDANGEVLAAWRCDAGPNAGRLFASRASPNGVWSAAAQEIGTGGTSNSPVKVAVDAQGNAVVVWRSATELFVAGSTNGIGWQAAQAIGAVTDGAHRNEFDVALGDQGRGLAVWVRNAGAQASQGTRLAQREVGPLAVTVTAQRYTFGGDAFPVTIRLGSPVAAPTSIAMERILPSGTWSTLVAFLAGDIERTLIVPSDAVGDFVSGSIEVSYQGSRVGQPFTLMPEPTAVQVALTPSAVFGGEATTLELRVLPGYPIAADVLLDSNQATVAVPAQVAVSAGTVASGSVATVQITSAQIASALSATVTARFRSASGAAPLQVFPNVPGQFLLTAQTVGSGAVASNPAGIVCPGDCAEPYALNSLVTLTATPSAGSSLTGWSGDCSGSATSVTVTLAAARSCTATFAPTTGVVPPVIVTQPQSQTVVAGTSVTFGVVATGSNLVYQWQKNGVAIPGASGSSMTIPNVGPANAGGFTVVVSNLVNGSALNGVTSSVAALNVVSATGWQNVGAPLSQVTSQRITMAVDHSVASAPVIYAAVAESVAGRINLLVRRFDGTNWVLVGGGPLNADALVSNTLFTPALYIEATGQVTVAWAENGRQVRVKRWNGSAWDLIGDNLSVDANAEVFSVQVTTFRGNLSAAWIEGAGGVGRITVKRWEASSRQWSGGRILPSETAVIALRLATDSGFALLTFVPQDPTLFAFEGPMRLLRETAFNVFAEPCPALPRQAPASNSGPTLPNVNLGFGVTRSLPNVEPVVVYNNGEAAFALVCSGGAWVALNGSATPGQIATIGPTGEDLIALTVAPSEDPGVVLAWSKQTRFNDGTHETTTQVLVNDSTGAALVEGAATLIQADSGFSPGQLSLGFFVSASEPVLAGTVQQSGQPPTSRVLRFWP